MDKVKKPRIKRAVVAQAAADSAQPEAIVTTEVATLATEQAAPLETHEIAALMADQVHGLNFDQLPPPDVDAAAEPPADDAADEPVTLELAPLPTSNLAEPRPIIVIELPDYLRECAIPIDSLATLPVDARARIESELGCRFDLKDGAVRAHDGRMFRIEHDHAAHTLELIGA